jgi:hemoglobin
MTQTPKTQPSVFEILVGEQGIRRLVDRFCDVMAIDKALTVLRHMHGTSLDQARDKLSWCLCGYFGVADWMRNKDG